MPNIVVTLTKVSTPLPGTAAFAKSNIVVTDGAGATQSASVTGTEIPPWSAPFNNIAAGSGSVTATDLDVNGATLGSQTQAFQTAPGGGTGTTFPQTSSIVVTAA